MAGLFACKSSQQRNDLFREIEKALSEVKGLTNPRLVYSPVDPDRRGTFSGMAALAINDVSSLRPTSISAGLSAELGREAGRHARQR